MWFAEFKNKVLDLKNKAVDTATQKIAETSLVLDNQKKVTDFIAKTTHKTIKLDSWEEIIFSKKVIIVCMDFKSELYKNFILTQAPNLTKWFAQNTPVRIIDRNNWSISLTNLLTEEEIFLIVFDDNKELVKISWEKKVKRFLDDLYESDKNKDFSEDENSSENKTDSDSWDFWWWD